MKYYEKLKRLVPKGNKINLRCVLGISGIELGVDETTNAGISLDQLSHPCLSATTITINSTAASSRARPTQLRTLFLSPNLFKAYRFISFQEVPISL